MGCQHLEDEYELYLLGAFPGEAPGDLESHLRDDCPNCLQGLREAAESVYWLVQSADPVRPRPAVRLRLAARLDSAGSTSVRAAAEPVRGRDRTRPARKR
ncbi:MAG TPA: hypothetical protein VG860_22445 [Terriglobia bacterium]|jgi:hypothetical protein|nr:hypothetical protein [Terriglobia bacterium]